MLCPFALDALPTSQSYIAIAVEGPGTYCAFLTLIDFHFISIATGDYITGDSNEATQAGAYL